MAQIQWQTFACTMSEDPQKWVESVPMKPNAEKAWSPKIEDMFTCHYVSQSHLGCNSIPFNVISIVTKEEGVGCSRQRKEQ